jgi:uncharacterized protein (TIGR03435 family)
MRSALLFLVCVPSAIGQERAVFDVVSLKHVGDQRSNSVQTGPGAFLSNIRGFKYSPGAVSCRLPLMSILSEAYQVRPFQIQGPEWLDQEVYEIDARMPDGTSKETARLMVRSALADRMGLKLRRERKEFALFVLAVIPGTKKLEEVLPTPPTFGYSTRMDTLEADPGMPTSSLAGILSRAAGRPVLDETGLKGFYKVKLHWNADPPTEGVAVTHLGADAGIISALPQIGLKLEPAKRMMDWLVIETVAKEPTEN